LLSKYADFIARKEKQGVLNVEEPEPKKGLFGDYSIRQTSGLGSKSNTKLQIHQHSDDEDSENENMDKFNEFDFNGQKKENEPAVESFNGAIYKQNVKRKVAKISNSILTK
jgi:hypothetical protein